MKITTSAYNDMIKTVGSRPAEAGGLLIGSRTDWVVTRFLYDKDAKTTTTSYSFNAPFLNSQLDKLADEDLQLLGFFHSHPQGCRELSTPDREYFKRQFKNIPVDKFLTPLMLSAVDGSYDFIPYVFHKDGRTQEVELEVVPDNYKDYLATDTKVTTEVEVPVAPVPMAIAYRLVAFYKALLWMVLLTGLVCFTLAMLTELYTYFANLLNPAE